MSGATTSVGILGGTFDPVHNGHISIAESFLNSGYIDSLLILPSPDPPHKAERNFTDYLQRFKMLKAAFEAFENVTVSDLEYTLPRPSYTIQTLQYLNESEPGSSFFLCLGQDSFNNFKNWHKWQEILKFCELLVADRPGVGGEKIPNELLNKTHFVKHKPLEISSSQIRVNIQQNRSVADLVPAGVLNIIKEAKLYRK